MSDVSSSAPPTPLPVDRRVLFVLVSLLLIFYAWDLGSNPAYLYVDAVVFALQAHAIATTAHDTNGRLLPLYFQMRQIADNSYIASVVMMPVYLLLTVLVLFRTVKRPFKECLVAVAGFAAPFTIVILWLAANPAVIQETMSRYAVSSDSVTRVAFSDLTRLLLGFGLAPLAACLLPEPYAIDRELVVLPFAVLLATLGVRSMMTSTRPHWRLAGAALLALIPIHFAFFCVDYWSDYPTRAAYRFQGNRRGALEQVIAMTPPQAPASIYLNDHRIPYIGAHWQLYLLKHDRVDLIGRTVYSTRARSTTVPCRRAACSSRRWTTNRSPTLCGRAG